MAATVLTAPASPRSAARTWWKPVQGQPWHLQLNGTPLLPKGVKVVDLDGNDTTAATVAAAHAKGMRAICYINAGGWEEWRPDAGRFPAAVRGRDLDDWPGEKWLDIRRTAVLLPIMAARMDQCRAKGFDAVDPDNLDGYQASTGFPITAHHAVAYQTALAQLAHQRGLAIGLKNATDLVPRLAGVVDFAVNEECLAYQECVGYQPLLARRRPVFHVEYTGERASICARRPKGFSSILASQDLDGATQRC